MILASQVMSWGAVYGLMIKPHLQLHSARSPLETCRLPFSACPPRRAHRPGACPEPGGRQGQGAAMPGARGERGPATGLPSPNQPPDIANASDRTSLGMREREKFFHSWKFNYRGVAIKDLFNMLPLSALPVITVQPALKEYSWASSHRASALSPLSVRSLC